VKQTILNSRDKAVAGTLILLATSALAVASMYAATDPNFDRAQKLVLNLNKVAGSSGFYLLKSMREIDVADHDLTKALRQVEEVEKTYARLRGRPDDKFLETTQIKIQKAMQSRNQYEEDLRDAYSQLKADIQHTLLMDQGKPQKEKSKGKDED